MVLARMTVEPKVRPPKNFDRAMVLIKKACPIIGQAFIHNKVKKVDF